MAKDSPVSAVIIAGLLGRHYVSVLRAIGRLKIKPDLISGKYKFYSKEHLPAIRKAMRSQNQKPRKLSTPR